MADLVLPLKAEYFNAIKAGTKPEEFRLRTPFWRLRAYVQSYGICDEYVPPPPQKRG